MFSALFFLVLGGAMVAVDQRANVVDSVTFLLIVLPFSLIGGLVTSRRPENRLGWIMATAGLALAISGVAEGYAHYTLVQDPGILPGGLTAAWLSNVLGTVFFFLALQFTLQLFPNGQVLNARWGVVLRATTTGMLLLATGIAFAPGPMEDLPYAINPFGLPGTLGDIAEALSAGGWLMATVSLLLSVISIGLRWRRSRGEERLQLKWFALAGLILLVFMIAATATERWELLTVPFIGVPAAVGIAILKYRLYDIDVVINKTIVFGVLAAFITGIYVAIVVGIGTLLGSQDEPNLALSIAATAVVAIAFSPIKERTERLANRLVYGYRLSPYEVLTDLSRVAATAPTPNDVLIGVAQAATTAVNAKRAKVTLYMHDGSEVRQNFPPGLQVQDASGEMFVISHESETLGRISVHKQATDPATPRDQKLLEDLAAQAGLALYNARLVLELRARLDEISAQAGELEESRSRIVSAADDARRRLEKDITEGPRKDLVAIGQELQRARDLMEHDPTSAATLLEELTAHSNETLDALRELARGIYPPLLADKGIVAALEAHVRKHDLPVDVNADPVVAEARLDESIETVVFFCSVEALSESTRERSSSFSLEWSAGELNVSMHRVSLSQSTWASIRDRVEALGGSVQSVDGHLAMRVPCAMKELAQ